VAVTVGAVAALALALIAPAASSASRAPDVSTPKCGAADLGVWVALDQASVASGTSFFQLEFTNLSHHACTLRGFPGVSAIGGGGQLGSPAVQDHAVAASTVRLAPGGTAYALLEYLDVVAGNCPSAAKRTAFELQVFPPGQSRANHAFWDLTACTARGSVFLKVRVIAPGIGVRGDFG
jgi:hypothetical protein